MADISKLPVITIGREYGAGGKSIIRIALVVSGVLLIVPSILTDIIGAVAIALSIMCQIFLSRKLN